jgi:double stranded RNA-specific editase B
MQLQVADRTFYACGSSKKTAKQRCAQIALESLYNVNFQPHHSENKKYKNFKQFADLIDKLIRDEVSKLKEQMENDILKQHYVYAAVVQTNDYLINGQTKIISFTTGTKCINGEYMSQNGLSLNDCHAEILALRLLRHYLYDQLEVYVTYLLGKKNGTAESASKDDFIFEFPNSDSNMRKFCLKESVKFHLYISTTPCGDG